MRCLVVLGILLFGSFAHAKRIMTPKTLSLVVVGDVGLNRSNLKVHPDGILEGNSVLAWTDLTAGIKHLINGDLNFMNLETVVTERNDLRPGDKRQKSPYLFRSHPKGIAHLLKIGFNLIGGANNHAYDYGEKGAKETVGHLRRLAGERPNTVVAGIGLNVDEAARPATTYFRGVKVAFSSIGIVTNMLTHHRAGPDKAGTLGFRHEEDWRRSLDELEAATASIKLMSVHYGVERDIRTDDRQRKAWRDAVANRGVDVVIGHHAHVVRGVEMHKGRLIFYGLGNFLIRGAANMGKKPELRTCCDYGLLAKVHFLKGTDGYKVGAVEAIPVFDMHRVARVLSPAEAGKRIEVLNALAEPLDDPSQDSVGVRFTIRDDGTGLFCTKEGKAFSELASLCANYHGAAPVSAEVRQRVKRAPRASSKKKKRGSKGKKRKRSKRK